jgi:hypothetical protein
MAFKRYLMMFIMTVFITVVKSQPTDPSDPNNPDPGGPQGGAVPVDAGLGILLAAGAGYGVKKVYDYRKKSRKDQETGSPKE